MDCRKTIKSNSFFGFLLFAVCDAVGMDYMFYAASVAYYTLMSIIPLFIFIMFLGIVTFHIDLKVLIPHQILESPLKPLFNQVERFINTSGIVSGTAAVVMLWFSRGIFLSMEKAFCEILGKESPTGFFYKNIAVIFAIFLLWVLLILFHMLKYFILLIFPSATAIPFISSVSILLTLFLILFSMYFFLLPVKFPPKEVLKVSAFIFLTLAIFEKVFIWFIVNVSRVGILYGSFAAVIVFLIWIYYSSTMILIGVGILKGKLLAETESENHKNDKRNEEHLQ